MWPAFPASDYYGGSAPPTTPRQTMRLSAASLAGQTGGRLVDGSHVHHAPLDGMGAQLFPGGLATTTPQHFVMASGPANP
jgi:hypothetical protein